MRVFRGRARSLEADRAISDRLLEVAADGDSAVRVWVPHRQVAFGRRDARLEGYELARASAHEMGFPPVERSVGGRAVAYDGETTLAFARAEPIEDFREGTGERYDRLTRDLEEALADLGLAVDRGEPDASFCPGSHSLALEGRKVAGLAQRVNREAAVVSGILIVDRAVKLAAVLEPVYDALSVPFDPNSVGSVAPSGSISADRIRDTLEDALVGDHPADELRVEA